MYNENEMAIIGALNSKKSYDSKHKELFSRPGLLAPILKYTIDEYENSTLEEIIGYIDKENMEFDCLVAPFQKIKSSTESKSYTEIDVTFDMKFNSKIPNNYIKRSKSIQIIVDYELQGVYNKFVPYRSRYYLGRLISMQLQLYLREGDYDTLKKVYTIWLLNSNVPKEYSNSILKFRIYGTKTVEPRKEIDIDLPNDMDFGTIVFIMRDSKYKKDSKNEYMHPLFEYLDGIYNGDKELYSKYLSKDETKEVEGRLKTMGSIAESIEMIGVEKGIERGIAQGISIGEKRGIDIGEKRGISIGEKRGIDIGEKRGISIGEKRGISIGEKRGISIGEKRGIDIGEKQGITFTAERLIKQGKLSFEDISAVTGLSVKELKEISNK